MLRRSLSLHFKAITPLRTAKHRLRCPYQSIAVARRGFASPSPRAALLRSAVAVLVASWPSYPMPLRRASFPVLHGAVRCFAPPSPCLALLRLSIPLPFHAWPSIFVAGLRRAFLFRRRSAQCEALPSPPRANQRASSATPFTAAPSPSLSMLCFSFARLTVAKPLRCCSEQIRALPSPFVPARCRHRDSFATPSLASPQHVRAWPR